MFMGLRIDEVGHANYNEVFFLFFKEMMKSDLQNDATGQGIEIVRKAEISSLKKLNK